MDEPIRLNKFLASRLGLSRREADEAITAGRVTINGAPAQLGARIDKTDKVCYNMKIVPFAPKFIYLALNKPVGYVCSRRAQGPAPTIYSLLPPHYRELKTVGRLDKDSSGLIILTNDGDYAYRMTHPKFRKQKVYQVTLDKPLVPLHQQEISDYGVMLPDGVSKFLVVKDEDGKGSNNNFDANNSGCHLTVILSEGRNRQIRRTFAALGYEVVKLHRTQFGPLKLTDLKPGEFVEFQP